MSLDCSRLASADVMPCCWTQAETDLGCTRAGTPLCWISRVPTSEVRSEITRLTYLGPIDKTRLLAVDVAALDLSEASRAKTAHNDRTSTPFRGPEHGTPLTVFYTATL